MNNLAYSYISDDSRSDTMLTYILYTVYTTHYRRRAASAWPRTAVWPLCRRPSRRCGTSTSGHLRGESVSES